LDSFVPSPHDLDALLVRRQGDLREQPYRLLLLAIARREKSGVLTLRRGPLEKDVVFDSGAAVACHSNIATETLGRFLVSSGRISEGQYQDALSVSAARGVALEELLAERQIVTSTELTRAAQQNLGRKLLEPFHWTQGTWHFSYDAPDTEVVHRVRVPQLLITGIGKVEPYETIEAALQETRELSAGSSPLFDPSELRLSEEQQRTLAKIRAGTSLDELRSTAAAAEDVERFVFALLLLGVAIPERATPSAPFFELDIAPEAPAPTPPPVVAPSPPAMATSLAPIASSDELAAAASRSKDAFELLGLDGGAGAMEITRAFLRMAERFLPARYDERSRDQAQEVFLASARAYAELADPLRRQALIDRRAPKRELASAAPPPPAPIPAPAPAPPRRAIIDPEELYREGRAAVAAGKLRDALGYFEMAADCDAQNGTYAAEVAYCRFQLLISPAAATVKSLKNAIRIDPRCGVAYLYLGKIQEAMGNHVEAQAYLGRASMLMQRPKF
jgi:hypothetical protein